MLVTYAGLKTPYFSQKTAQVAGYYNRLAIVIASR